MYWHSSSVAHNGSTFLYICLLRLSWADLKYILIIFTVNHSKILFIFKNIKKNANFYSPYQQQSNWYPDHQLSWTVGTQKYQNDFESLQPCHDELKFYSNHRVDGIDVFDATCTPTINFLFNIRIYDVQSNVFLPLTNQ